jgi:hypothetical protein
MKKFLTVVALVSITFAGFQPQAVTAKVRDPQRYCRTSEGNGWSSRDVRQAIRCAVEHWNVPGGKRKALSVARCESGFDPHNTTSLSSAKGVYQFLDGTWAAVRRHYQDLRRRWNMARSVFNARANVVLAIRYAHAGGWSPWSCA